MNVVVREREAGLDAGWDDFVETSENGGFYSYSAWSAAVAELTGQRLHRIVAEDGGGRLLAGVVILVRSRWGLRAAGKPWATPYCGVVYRPDLGHRDKLRLDAALAGYLADHFDLVRLETAPGFSDLLAFERSGWDASVKNTFLLARDGLPLERRAAAAVRRQLRKAARAGAVVEQGEDGGPLFDLYCELYRRQRQPLAFDRSAFQRFCRRLLDSSRATLWYARQDGAVRAGMLVGRSRGWHYYSLASFDRVDALKVGPTLLLGAYFDFQMAPGETLDLVGANAYLPGVTDFKSKFNPREQPYLVLEYPKTRVAVPRTSALLARALTRTLGGRRGRRAPGGAR